MKKNKIYYRRKELGLTLEEVGKAVGVSKSTVAKWETGFIENMKRDKIALLAKVLDIDPIELIRIDEPSKFVIPIKKLTFDEEVKNAVETIELEHVQQITDLFSCLSYYGQIESINRIKELTQIKKYRRTGSDIDFLKEAGILISENNSNEYALKAAHERTNIEVTDEMRKIDDDIMDDENF